MILPQETRYSISTDRNYVILQMYPVQVLLYTFTGISILQCDRYKRTLVQSNSFRRIWE